jgi:hypothetical protein
MTMCHSRPSGPERELSEQRAYNTRSCSRVTDRPAQSHEQSISQRRTQSIAHHEKTLGFVDVWYQIGGDHYRDGAPTFRITILGTSSNNPYGSKVSFQDRIRDSVICLTSYLLSRSLMSRPSVGEKLARDHPKARTHYEGDLEIVSVWPKKTPTSDKRGF